MKKRSLVLSVGLGALLGVLIHTVNAGVEPSPFQPEINQLGAVANILVSADYRVARNIAHPPDPCVPPDPCSPSVNGAINSLEAIQNQVSSADDMVRALIEEVMGFEPSPFSDLLPPLEIVRDGAAGIADRIGVFLATGSAASLPVEYLGALEAVEGSALGMVDTVEEGIERLSGSMECASYLVEDECNAVIGCVWIDAGVAAPFCAVAGI